MYTRVQTSIQSILRELSGPHPLCRVADVISNGIATLGHLSRMLATLPHTWGREELRPGVLQPHQMLMLSLRFPL